MAAIDRGEDEAPAPVGVVQVKDGGEAQDQAEKLIEECGGNPDDGGLAISGDWLVIAETDEIAEKVVDDAAAASLADDDEFKKWTDAAGDPGILTAYASPDAGKMLAEFAGLGGALAGGGITDCGMEEIADGCLPTEHFFGTSDDGPLPDEALDMFEDFGGLAMTVRFDDGSLEIETAGESGQNGLASLTSSDAGADVIATLPEDTAAAFGAGFEPGWFQDLLDYVGDTSGMGEDIDGLLAEAEEELDLSLPDDAETLFGDSAAVAVGSHFDPEAFFSSESGALGAPDRRQDQRRHRRDPGGPRPGQGDGAEPRGGRDLQLGLR